MTLVGTALTLTACTIPGCSGLYGGSGQLPSADHLHKAQFAGTFDGDASGGRVSGQFSDAYAPGGPVAMSFSRVAVQTTDGCVKGVFPYRSTAAASFGQAGQLSVQACIDGHVSLSALSGPFAGYRDSGALSGVHYQARSNDNS